MKKAAFIIAEKVFRDEEYTVPKEILDEAGIEVLTVSTTTNEAIGKLGLKVKPDLHLDDLEVEDLDAIIFIGGGGAEQYFDDKKAHEIAKEAAEQDKIVGAICIAPVILANAGLLTDKQATVFPDGKDVLLSHGAHYTGNLVEVDGKTITGNGPDAAEKFGHSLVRLLQA